MYITWLCIIPLLVEVQAFCEICKASHRTFFTVFMYLHLNHKTAGLCVICYRAKFHPPRCTFRYTDCYNVGLKFRQRHQVYVLWETLSWSCAHSETRNLELCHFVRAVGRMKLRGRSPSIMTFLQSFVKIVQLVKLNRNRHSYSYWHYK